MQPRLRSKMALLVIKGFALSHRFFAACSVVVALFFSSINIAFAQGRVFPEQSRLARLAIGVAPLISLNGVDARLSPGSLIRNPQNQILVPSMVQGTPWVRFTVDTSGNVDQVWILSEAELAREPRQGQAPFRR